MFKEIPLNQIKRSIEKMGMTEVVVKYKGRVVNNESANG